MPCIDDSWNRHGGARQRARARRPRKAWRPRRARGALPPPLRPYLQLPAHECRQPARRRGPDHTDVSEDARVDRPFPVEVGAVLGLALPHRPQPRDGLLPCRQARPARGGGPRAARLRGGLRRVPRVPLDRARQHARSDRAALARAAPGPDAEVRVQLRERRGRRDPRQDRRRREIAPAPGAGLAPEARRARLTSPAMALSVGIVGLPGAGKTTLFNALTGAGAFEYGKEHVGMAAIADERLDRVAAVIGSAKKTPAAIRVVDVPGTGAQLLGNLRQADAILAVLDGFSANAAPDRETLKRELQVADRDHVERRLERLRKEAKSGDPGKKAEAARLEKLLAHVEADGSLADEGDLPPELEPLTTKPLIPIVNGPQG